MEVTGPGNKPKKGLGRDSCGGKGGEANAREQEFSAWPEEGLLS